MMILQVTLQFYVSTKLEKKLVGRWTVFSNWQKQDFSINYVLPTVWHYGLWSFQAGGTKLEIFLPKNQHTFWHFLTPCHLPKFSKFNNFLWVCWFLGKNIFNFVPPAWKLHNPYCHTRAATCKIRAKKCRIFCKRASNMFYSIQMS